MNIAANDYDKVPYESFPYANTDPEHLYTIAKLFSLDAVDPKEARVLELGCASGGNLIPMAVKYPKGTFVGIDLSQVQIEEGQRHIESLKLSNISLQHLSITDLTKDFGKFDYIIVHGILSWVPKNVQDKIFAACNENLSEKGIAYVSYNTLPGWNVIRSIREMMLYHTARFDDPAQKASEARKLLNFVKEGNGEAASPYKDFIAKEIETIQGCGDSYLVHDHMEEHNDPFYFHDFMAKADAQNLQYVGETEVPTMFTGNLPQATAEVLKPLGNDIVRVEQYMDFIRNRRFRSTLLCHKGRSINRNITSAKMKEFYVVTKARADKKIEDIDLTRNEMVQFSVQGTGWSFTTSNQAVIRAMLYMADQKAPVAVTQVLAEVKKRIGKAANAEAVEAVVLEALLRIFLSNGLTISAFAPRFVTSVTDKPKASDLVRYQAKSAGWVTSQRSEKISVDKFGCVMLQYLDGQNDVEAITKKMIAHVSNKEFILQSKDGVITDEAVVKKEVERMVRESIEKCAPTALLVA